MKLYIKQKVFTLKDRFTVMDEAGHDRYTVEGELFSLGRKLHVYDLDGREVISIQQKVWSFLPRYEVYVGGTMVAEIVREFTWLRPRYTINQLDWTVEGSFWEHTYSVMNGETPVVSIEKEWMSWGDSYELDIADPADELKALAVVLTIDCVNASSNNN